MTKYLIVGLLSIFGLGLGVLSLVNYPAYISPANAFEATATPIPDTMLVVDADMANADWTPIIREFDGVEMVLVPAGCFEMGYTDGIGNEVPVHEQCVSEPFWLDRYEVSNAQFGAFIYWDDPNFPYAGASWEVATEYCLDRGGRLPSEVEWEYAARGVDGWLYPWGNELIDANVTHSDNSIDPTSVTSHPDGVSWVGAYNMSGNIAEWTSSVYLDYPYDTEHQAELAHAAAEDEDTHDDTRHTDHDTENFYTVRGGSFTEANLLYITSAGRYGLHADEDLANLGMRCARDYWE